jgi:hypothetical protein
MTWSEFTHLPLVEVSAVLSVFTFSVVYLAYETRRMFLLIKPYCHDLPGGPKRLHSRMAAVICFLNASIVMAMYMTAQEPQFRLLFAPLLGSLLFSVFNHGIKLGRSFKESDPLDLNAQQWAGRLIELTQTLRQACRTSHNLALRLQCRTARAARIDQTTQEPHDAQSRPGGDREPENGTDDKGPRAMA